MKTGEAWFADTEYYHSQFNGSEVDRIHIVASLVTSCSSCSIVNKE
jgi:hypothetical protein